MKLNQSLKWFALYKAPLFGLTFRNILRFFFNFFFQMANHNPFGAELLANNAIHAGVVIGKSTKGNIQSQTTDLKLIFDKEIIDTWSDKKWPYDMLSEVEWLVKEQSKIGNILKKGDLILTGAYGLPIPINDKKLIEVTSSLFGNVSAVFQ